MSLFDVSVVSCLVQLLYVLPTAVAVRRVVMPYAPPHAPYANPLFFCELSLECIIVPLLNRTEVCASSSASATPRRSASK